MPSWYNEGMLSIREQAILLWKNGRSYSEIQKTLKAKIPKSTLSYWMKYAQLTPEEQKRISKAMQFKIAFSQKRAVLANKEKRDRKFLELKQSAMRLLPLFKDNKVSKIVLAILYATEGSRTRRSSLMFGNSDPSIITLFLGLLRKSYSLDETKFRCTVQCRADQNTKELIYFWSKTTRIPIKQFYAARIDARSIGKPSRKKDYKGVCRIDYFSADIYNELRVNIEKILSAEGL